MPLRVSKAHAYGNDFLLVAAADAGVTAVVQPGGSIRDGEELAAADAAGMAVVVTGVRHFRH